jgi:hypothetical protein
MLTRPPAYLQLPPEYRVWNQPLKQALRLCGTPMAVKRASRGIFSSAEKFLVVLTLGALWWQRVTRQTIVVDDMYWNELEQALGGRSKNNNVSVDGYIKVTTAAHKTLQTSESRCGNGLGRKLTCPNQFCDRLGEPRRPDWVFPESMRSLDVNMRQ